MDNEQTDGRHKDNRHVNDGYKVNRHTDINIKAKDTQTNTTHIIRIRTKDKNKSEVGTIDSPTIDTQIYIYSRHKTNKYN